MQDNKGLIQEAIRKIGEVSELFYQQNNKKAYQEFHTVLECLTLVAQSLYTSEEVSEQDRNVYLNLMREAMEAMEGKDWILLADILQYDMNEFLEDMLKR